MYILSNNDLNYSIHVYEFQVNYTCKEGYYFGSDYNQQAFSLECHDNGSFANIEWERCYHPSERFCFDPPEPPYNGGIRDWNEAMYNGSRTPYGAKVTYSCGLGRQLLQYTYDDEILYNSTQYECQWDRT